MMCRILAGDLVLMFVIIIFVLVVVVLCYLFYLKRVRESAAFKDASFADFVEFDRDRVNTPGDKSVANEIAAGVISAAAASIEQRNAPLPGVALEETADYAIRDSLFDGITRSFLATLDLAIGEDHRVLLNVPVSDLLRQNDDDKNLLVAGLERVDFVICEKPGLKAVCGIQLTGDSAGKLSRILKKAGLPLLQFSIGVDYSAAELREKLKDILVPAQPVGQCRKCHQDMVIKKVNRGKNEGRYFWVCNACRLTVAVR